MRLELEKLAASRKDTFSEMYEVVRTIEVVMDDEKYRVEIVKGVEDGGVYYDARYLVNRELILQPKTYADEAGRLSKPEEMRVWVEHRYVWVHLPDPDSALAEALTFLSEGRKKP